MNNTTKYQRFVALWSEVSKPDAWATIFYFIFWHPLWHSFCFVWVIVTGLASLVSLIFPPLGYFICIGTVMSWRYASLRKSLKYVYRFFLIKLFFFFDLSIDLWQELK